MARVKQNTAATKQSSVSGQQCSSLYTLIGSLYKTATLYRMKMSHVAGLYLRLIFLIFNLVPLKEFTDVNTEDVKNLFQLALFFHDVYVYFFGGERHCSGICSIRD